MYGLLITSGDEEFDFSPAGEDGFDQVREAAVHRIEAETKEELLAKLLSELNNDTVSDQNFYFLVDLDEETILDYPEAFC